MNAKFSLLAVLAVFLFGFSLSAQGKTVNFHSGDTASKIVGCAQVPNFEFVHQASGKSFKGNCQDEVFRTMPTGQYEVTRLQEVVAKVFSPATSATSPGLGEVKVIKEPVSPAAQITTSDNFDGVYKMVVGGSLFGILIMLGMITIMMWTQQQRAPKSPKELAVSAFGSSLTLPLSHMEKVLRNSAQERTQNLTALSTLSKSTQDANYAADVQTQDWQRPMMQLVKKRIQTEGIDSGLIIPHQAQIGKETAVTGIKIRCPEENAERMNESLARLLDQVGQSLVFSDLAPEDGNHVFFIHEPEKEAMTAT